MVCMIPCSCPGVGLETTDTRFVTGIACTLERRRRVAPQPTWVARNANARSRASAADSAWYEPR